MNILNFHTSTIQRGTYWYREFETWSHPEVNHNLRMFENSELRRIFAPMTEEVTEGWRKLHNDKFNNF
jgi:hypothetical protein